MAINGFMHSADILGKIIQFRAEARGCKDPQITPKASPYPVLTAQLFCFKKETHTKKWWCWGGIS